MGHRNLLDVWSGAATLSLLIALTSCSSVLGEPTPSLGSDEVELSAQTIAAPRSVPNSASDAEEVNGTTYLDSTVLELGYKDPSTSLAQTTGIRFASLDVPPGADIIDARIDFVAVTSKSEVTSLRIYGNDVGSAGPFIAGSNDLTSRTKTTANVTWSPAAWTDGTKYTSPNLATVVEEITSRSNWVRGAAMAFIISGTGQRKAHAFDANNGLQPVLRISYNASTSCLSGTGTLLTFNETYNTRRNVYDYGYNPVKVDARGGRVIRDVSAGNPAELFKVYNTRKSCIVGGTYRHVPNGAMQWSDWTPNRAFWLEAGTTAPSDRSQTSTSVEGVAVVEAGDAFTIKDYTYNWQIRDSYIGRTHDDAIESDRITNGVIDDVLVDSTHVGISCQQEIDSTDPRRDETVNVVVRNSMIALRDTSTSKHLYMFKMLRGGSPDASTPNCRFTLQDNVFLITHATIGDSTTYTPFNPNNLSAIKNANLPESKKPLNEAACVGHKNTIVYLGSNTTHFNNLKAESPTCFDVVQGSTFWNSKRSEWFDRHPEFAQYE